MRDNNVILETARKMSRMEGGTRFSPDAMAAGQSLIQLVGGPEKMHGLVEKYMQDETKFIKDLSPADRKSFLDVGKGWGHTKVDLSAFGSGNYSNPYPQEYQATIPGAASTQYSPEEVERLLKQPELVPDGRISPEDLIPLEDRIKDLIEKHGGNGPLQIYGLKGDQKTLESMMENLGRNGMNGAQMPPVEAAGPMVTGGPQRDPYASVDTYGIQNLMKIPGRD